MNTWEVIDAAATKPFGFMKFYPGPGLGGHCIPVDPLYLSWKLRTLKYEARFITLADEINSHMPHLVVEKTQDALNDQKKAINGSQDAGARHRLQEGHRRPARVAGARRHRAAAARRAPRSAITTRYCPSVQIGEHTLKSVPFDKLDSYDCVVIVTDHTSVDYKQVGGQGQGRHRHAQRHEERQGRRARQDSISL